MTTPSYPSMPQEPSVILAKSNGFAVTGFILGLLGLLFSFIPFIGVIAWPLVILGVIFSGIGLARALRGTAGGKGLSIAGLALSVIGLVICFTWLGITGSAVKSATTESTKQVTISYDITGDAKNPTISYSTISDGQFTDNQESNAQIPWHKEIQAQGWLRGGTLTATTGMDGGTISCKVTVDGKEAKTATASGPFATAMCSG